MSTLLRVAAAAAAFVLLGAGMAAADPGKGKGKHGGDHQASHKQAYRVHGGPPPWAPAHGYRRKHGGGYFYDYHYLDYGLAAPPLDFSLGRCNREIIGQIVGGAAGGLIGSKVGDGAGRIAAIAGGSILGIIIGGEIGRYMDRADAICVEETLEHLPDGEVVSWQSGDQRYDVTPLESYETEGRYCREYQTDVVIAGRVERAYGTACRLPDGSWEKVGG